VGSVDGGIVPSTTAGIVAGVSAVGCVTGASGVGIGAGVTSAVGAVDGGGGVFASDGWVEFSSSTGRVEALLTGELALFVATGCL
jgi:hypothetical protein